MMTESVIDRRQRNWLGALAMAVADVERAAAEKAAGQTGAAPAALVALTEFGGEPITSFASMLGVSESGAVRLFERLAGAGLVRRTAGRDGRTLAVDLTPKGRRTAQRVLEARAAAVEAILEALDSTEREQLAPLVSKMLASLRSGGVDPRTVCRLCDYEVLHRAEACPVWRALRPDFRGGRLASDAGDYRHGPWPRAF